MSDLTILHNDNGSVLDLSLDLEDYLRDTASVEYIAAEDLLYVGYDKPIASIYVELETANSLTADIDVKYYNGTDFVSADGQKDLTKGMTRSGFIKWERNLDAEENTVIDTADLYWYRIDFDSDTSAMAIKGINLVFTDDNDLKSGISEPSRYYPRGESSLITFHVAARDAILQRINNAGVKVWENLQDQDKLDRFGSATKSVDQWDLLKLEEVKEQSKYWVLAEMFFNASDEPDDKWYQKYEDYKGRYEASISRYLTIDKDNDGKIDNVEKVRQINGFIARV